MIRNTFTSRAPAKESPMDFRARMISQMKNHGFGIDGKSKVAEGKWIAVRDSQVDRPYERSGRFRFETSMKTGAPVCLFKSMKRELVTDYHRGDMSIEFAKGYGMDTPANSRAMPPVPANDISTPAASSLADKLALSDSYRASMDQAADKARSMLKDSVPAEGHGYLHSPGVGHAKLRQSGGNLVVPVFRPASDISKVELAGAQTIGADGFKMFVAGTKSNCGFTMIPAHADPEKWLAHLKKSDKSLVLCEGVGTALSVYHATGQPVLACFTAKNLPVVAEWLKDQGYCDGRKTIICADNDLDKRRDGTDKREADKFIGIREAVKAAEITGGKVALSDSAQSGYDARDLMRDKGSKAVSDLVFDARSVDQIKADRPEVFRSAAIEKEQQQEIPAPQQDNEEEVSLSF